MNQLDLQKELDVSRYHSVIIDVRECEQAPGNVRTVTIHQDYSVTIEFDTCEAYLSDSMEGGLRYIGDYSSLSELISDIESYLSLPIGEWINYSRQKYIPRVVAEVDPDLNENWFKKQVYENLIELPKIGGFQVANIYWKHIKKWGEYMPEMLGKEDE